MALDSMKDAREGTLGNTDPQLKLQYFGHLIRRVDSLEKTLMLGKIEDRWRKGQQRMRWLEEKGTTEDEMAGWHHRLDGREFE